MATSLGNMMVSLPQIAKVIDHSLLHPTMTDAEIREGLLLAKKHKVAAACIKPYSIPLAKEILSGGSGDDGGAPVDVLICAVVGFPHGNSTTFIKALEAEEAVKDGAHEIDMVVNVGKVLGGEWDYVRDEIKTVNAAVAQHGAALKVIFENDFLADDHIVRLCQICTALDVAFVKTSTGYGFVKTPGGYYTYRGATIPHLRLMLRNVGSNVQVKAAGGIRTLDELLFVMSLGVKRIGASATAEILKEASRRGINQEPVEVPIPAIVDTVDTAGTSR
ncbi:hypothetical protein MGN70_008726 [Eutypa lata]|nr:hypothetical protein MGN70_008726 [Eutypa lata]